MRALVSVVFALTLLAAPALGCVGDCDDDGAVTVDELVVGVQIGLGRIAVDRCRAMDGNGDGVVAISELVAAVDAGLRDCAAGATPTPTPGGGPLHCGDGVADADEECDDGNQIDGDGCSATCQLEPGGDPCAGVPAFPGAALTSQLVSAGFAQPVHVTAPRLDPHRLFVVEQAGRIRLLIDGALRDAAFLDLTGLVSCCGERGLLSVAFHPDYERNGRFFIDYTNTAGDTVIARYQVSADPERADPDSARVLLTIAQPFPNHNGGQLAFGPDGYLYIGMGDGGDAGDPLANGQNDDALLGKLLRMDVDVDDPPPGSGPGLAYAVPPTNPHAERGAPLGLIWSKGLRNPWRFSFDRATGDLYIGDVGQDHFEEIDVQRAASAGGENYGWRVFEANACFNPAPARVCPAPGGFTFPVLFYGHGDGCSVTGGFVYRGCALPDLRGEYFYSDYCTAFLRTFRLQGDIAAAPLDRTAGLAPGSGRSIDAVVSFGEDARGELYIVDYDGGELYRIVPVSQ